MKRGKYGLEIAEQDEKIWRERGYKINYNNGLLEEICFHCGKELGIGDNDCEHCINESDLTKKLCK